MYPNAASTFILGLISPTPLFSEEGTAGDGGGDESFRSNENDWRKISDIEECKRKRLMSGTYGNDSFSDFITHHQNLFNDGGVGTHAGASDWETSGNSKEWPVGDELTHQSSSGENSISMNSPIRHDNTDNYINYLHRQYKQQLSAAVSHSAVNGNHDGNGTYYCDWDYDDILCWPKTVAGNVATLPCFDNLHGIPYNASGKKFSHDKL